MNPTDQARKEARKRELKKNKKQRMMVRAAVLKMKDPKQIIRDMEKLDEMEFNPVQQPQLNEKVLKDKRKKLRETFERILRLYEKENPDTFRELRKLEQEYEQKRSQLSQYFDAVKNAQHVEVETIPLPDMPHAPSSILVQDIPLPGAQPASILKKTSAYGPAIRPITVAPPPGFGVPRLPPGKKPPGPPPGPPPPQLVKMYGRKVGFSVKRVKKKQKESVLYNPEIATDSLDEESPSEDEGYREEMDQDDEHGGGADDDSEMDDSEGQDSDEEDLRFQDGEKERKKRAIIKKSGHIVRFADVADKQKQKKKKPVKEITPVQAMMLRMAGQELPDDDEEEEDDDDDDDDEDEDDDNDDDDQEDQEDEEEETDEESDTEESKPQEESRPEAPAVAPPQLPAAPQAVIPAPAMPVPPPLGPPPAPPLRPPGPPSGLPPGPPPGAPPFLRPPGLPALRAPLPRLLPPGPPPGRPPGPPPGPPPGLPPGPPPRGPPPRLPPAAPPGLPPPRPGLIRPPIAPPPSAPPPVLFPPAPIQNAQNPGVLSAPPSLIQRPKSDEVSATIEKKATTTITAKPQITNPKADVTRFVPTALRVRRENKSGVVLKKLEEQHIPTVTKPAPKANASVVAVQTKDDVYESFMKEMEGLL